MDRTEAEARMKLLLGPATVALLTQDDIDYALDQSLTWDEDGRAPGSIGYIDTYDPYWAAAEAASLLAGRAMAAGGVLEFTSENSTFKRSAPDFMSLARWLRSQSPMSPEYGTGLGLIEVDGRLSYYRPTSDRLRGGRGVIGNWS